MSFKVLVTGSRDLADWQTVYQALDDIYATKQPMIIIHGAARGADAFADAWAVYRSNVTVVRVPADWENDGRAAGPIRNARMLELGPDLVLAFFQARSANIGTSHMVKIAHKAGVEVRSITVD